MKALQIDDVGHTSLVEVASESPGEGEVKVRISYVGLCGSDLNTFRGLNPLVTFPRIPGHEAVGVVMEAGPGVPQAFSPGKSVLVWPYSACGKCTSCRADRAYACRYNQTLGVQRDGALREEMVLRAEALIPNSTLPPKRLVLVEPLSVGLHAARRGSAKTGDTVVVLGCGMIGLGAILGAAHAGADVIAVDTSPGKEQIARAMGARHFIPATGEALLAAVMELTSGDGADLLIEAVGSPDTFTMAVDLAAFTGRVVYVGYSKAPVTYETKFFNLKELDIFGSRNASREDFTTAIAAIEAMGEQADMLITREFQLLEADRALPFWADNPSSVLKLVVKL